MVTMTCGRSPPAVGSAAGGEGCFAGADEAVEESLGPGAPVQVRHQVAADPAPLSCCVSAPVPSSCLVPPSPGAGVLGAAVVGAGCGVRGLVAVFMTVSEVFVLVGGGEDFEVVEAAAGVGGGMRLGGGGVLLRRVRCRPGRWRRPSGGRRGRGSRGRWSAAVRVRSCSIRAVVSAVGVVPDPVQGGVMIVPAREATGPAADGGGEFGPDRGLGVAGEGRRGAAAGGRAIRAAGFGDADPQPGRGGTRRRSGTRHATDPHPQTAGIRRCFCSRRPPAARAQLRGGPSRWPSRQLGSVTVSSRADPSRWSRADCPADRAAAAASRAGPVHGPGREDLQVLHGPGEFLGDAGVIRGLTEAEQRQWPRPPSNPSP